MDGRDKPDHDIRDIAPCLIGRSPMPQCFETDSLLFQRSGGGDLLVVLIVVQQRQVVLERDDGNATVQGAAHREPTLP
jgi:hypothetical protein